MARRDAVYCRAWRRRTISRIVGYRTLTAFLGSMQCCDSGGPVALTGRVRWHTRAHAGMIWTELLKMLGAPAGAFAAAWAGAHLGFRRTKRERALERRINWHEQTIQALARYEERLESLHRYSRNALIIQRSRPDAAPIQSSDAIPKTVKVPQAIWSELRDAEEPARAALRLADLYTDLETQVACSTAVTNTVNVVSSQWIDIGPEPNIPWDELRMKAIRTGSVRLRLQDSLKRVLELDGFIAALFPSTARRRLTRRIERMRTKIAQGAS